MSEERVKAYQMAARYLLRGCKHEWHKSAGGGMRCAKCDKVYSARKMEIMTHG